MTAISATITPARTPHTVTWTGHCPDCLGLATWTQVEGGRPVVECPCEDWRKTA